MCTAPAREPKPATVEQIQALTDAVPAHMAAAIQLAAYGGLRWGEIKALHDADIEIRYDDSGQVVGGIVHVQRGISNGTETTPKTKAGVRDVHLPIQAARYLAGHLGHFVGTPVRRHYRGCTNPEAHVFDKLHENASWYRALKRAGMEGFRFHDLRHTFASLSVANGVEARAVQAALGHATASITAHYTHATPDYAERVASTLNAFLESNSTTR